MTSTEFTIGMSGARNSSKVLRPPGGGSSDIFGQDITINLAAPAKNQTRNRIFGDSEVKPQQKYQPKCQSDILGRNEQNSALPSQKKYMQRNPITGEGMEYDVEKNGEDEEERKENIGTAVAEKKVVVLPPSTNAKVTSFRVRQPPGGKSSGIF